MIANIICREATPQLTTLAAGAITVGSAAGCDIRVIAASVAPQHCLLTFNGNQVLITNLDAATPARLGGILLPPGRPQPWPTNTPLHIGQATLYLTLTAAGRQPPALGRQWSAAGRRLRWLLLSVAALGLGTVCLLSLVAAIWIQRGRCTRFDLACLQLVLAGSAPGSAAADAFGVATPTLAPLIFRTPTPSGPRVIDELPTITPGPAGVVVNCTTAQDAAVGGGWLDLPFPYRGTDANFGGPAEEFRRISQRSRSGGRINTFFDHEYPVYPPRFSGWEPSLVADTLVLFDGSRSADGYSQDSSNADYYSGHTGIDFAPVNPLQGTTPVLAAAAGRLLLAQIDSDGNHMVWLEHDPDGDGRYDYATYYFHLLPDAFFDQMVALHAAAEESGQRASIEAGFRLGTMGTTGRSTGIHLHFEVRRDANGDRHFGRLETVDPYGFFPSEEFPIDPWAQVISLITDRGEVVEHQALTSDYLWRHPLFEVEEAADVCEASVQVEVDLYPVLGWAVVDPGFTFIARNDQGQAIDQNSRPRARELTILPADLVGVDLATLRLQFRGPLQSLWRTEERIELLPRSAGGYTLRAQISHTGRYVLVARQNADRNPPRTTIRLEGQAAGESTFVASVLVTLDAPDQSPAWIPPAGLKQIRYSLDCGVTWTIYNEPFRVSAATPHACGAAGTGEQGIELGPNDFILLAIAEDFNDNIEQPAGQARFTIIGE